MNNAGRLTACTSSLDQVAVAVIGDSLAEDTPTAIVGADKKNAHIEFFASYGLVLIVSFIPEKPINTGCLTQNTREL